MKLLETAAVPFNLVLSRYEKVETARAFVIDASIEAISMIIESQALQDEMELETMEGPITADKLFTNPAVKDEAFRMRGEWDKKGWDKELLRSITMALFKVRGDFHPPALLIYSVPDDDFITVACRDVLLTSDGFHRQLPVLRTKTLLKWPLRDHNSTDDKELPLKCRGRERIEYDDGMEVTLQNKELGTTALKAEAYDDAKYSYGLASLVLNRITEELEPEQHLEIRTINVALNSNSALCALKQENWLEAIDYATRALEIDPNNAKALYRRAQAYDAREDWDEAIADLEAALIVAPEDVAIPKLLSRAKKGKSKQAGKQKALYSKMLSK